MSCLDRYRGIMKRYLTRSVVTVFLLCCAFMAFWLPPQPETTTTDLGDGVSVTITEEHGHPFFEWIGIALLALALWNWRDVLRLTGIGPLSGPLLEQQTPDEVERAAVELQAARTFAEAQSETARRRFQDGRDWAVDFLTKHHALNPTTAANELRISRPAAEALLDNLVAEGLARRDGFPRRSLYTLAGSIENRALDLVRDEYVVPSYRLLSERRFVRAGSYELDAVLECEERTFLVEIKFQRSAEASSQIKSGAQHLVSAANHFPERALGGYLVLVVWDHEHYSAVKQQVAGMTLDSANLPIIVLAVAKEDLREANAA